MKEKIFTYDTTLRDGTQGEEVAFSADDKVKIAKRLDAFGIDYIEGGWPGSNPKDMEFFELAKKVRFTHAKLAAFGSTRRAKNPVEERRKHQSAARRRDARRDDLRENMVAPCEGSVADLR